MHSQIRQLRELPVPLFSANCVAATGFKQAGSVDLLPSLQGSVFLYVVAQFAVWKITLHAVHTFSDARYTTALKHVKSNR